MYPIQNLRSFSHFSRHVFVIGRIYMERKKAFEEVDEHLQRMKKSIIRMSLSYSDIDRLREKVANLMGLERKYVKYFRPEDDEKAELKKHIIFLDSQLGKERGLKQRILDDNNEKIKQLSDTIDNLKNNLKRLQLEKAKRHQRLQALEEKINQRISAREYYSGKI